MFKNMQIYPMRDPLDLSPGGLEEILAKKPMQPCTGLSMRSIGFVKVAEGRGLVEHHEKHLLLAVGIEEKKVPASTVKRIHAERMIELEAKLGYKPGKKQSRDLKERIVVEMLPNIPAKYSEMRVWIDNGNRRVIVEASSGGKAETALEEMRLALGSLPVVRAEADPSIETQMTEWLRRSEAPHGFELDSSCELQDMQDGGPRVSYKNSDLTEKDVRDHLDKGKRCTKLAVLHGEDLLLTLTNKFEVKSVKHLAMHEPEEGEGDENDPFLASFMLLTDRHARLINDLFKALNVTFDSSTQSAEANAKAAGAGSAAADDDGAESEREEEEEEAEA